MTDYKDIYFIGIGGIGMSAIARYYKFKGYEVSGYDRTPSELTRELEKEGISVHYEDNTVFIPKNPETTLVVYTPAIPSDMGELTYVREHGYRVIKRSAILGEISRGQSCLAIAGTHGKTTTDEFDRSFLQLHPEIAAITAMDADHLDIYSDLDHVKEAFRQFASQTKGLLITKLGLDITSSDTRAKIYRYSYDDARADFYAENIRNGSCGHLIFDIVWPDGVIHDCTCGVPGWVNVENSVAAVAAVWCASHARGEAFDHDAVRRALASFEGVKRRFEFYVNTPRQVYMDDYAHHPEELEASIRSVRGMFPSRKLTAVFQPHLYTRTRDLYKEFAAALSHADEVVLLPIYPAREEPIAGVTSQMIADHVTVPCSMTDREHLASWLAADDTDVVVTYGAGNIDACCEAVAEVLRRKG